MTSVFPTEGTPAIADFRSQISNTLAQDPQALRFKKLLIYCCTGTWENNPARLEAIEFCALIQMLQSLAPCWQNVQISLAEAAQRLNKSAEYMLLAHTLLSLLKPLYPESALVYPVAPSVYEVIAQQFSADPDLLRLKKLLILACTNQWESDRKKIEQASLLSLIQTLHSLTPSRAVLALLLENLVKTLSKSSEYRLLADRLLAAFQPLYPDSHPESDPLTVPEDASQEQDTSQEQLEETASSLNSRMLATKFSTIAEATAALSALLHEQNKRSNSGSSGAIVKNAVPATSSKQKPLRMSLDERFSLRQSIVQACNPLRTKILLFSLLHEPFQLQQHEGILKEHDLDDLLQMTMQTYRQMAHLEAALSQVVKQLPNSQAYLQSVSALLQAVQQVSSHSSAMSANYAAPAPNSPTISHQTT